jgi:tRNA (mo5U34)-methyltransferase
MVFQSMQRGSQEVEPLDTDYDFEEADHFDAPGYPKLHFVENSYCTDTTNWWIPNRACAEAMLRSAGFEIVSHPEQEVYVCRWERLLPHPSAPFAIYPARDAGAGAGESAGRDARGAGARNEKEAMDHG